jgi:diadenosine tetraphosphatase ApaH/serine/threonine PP2A family protein phosphatase
VIPRVWSGLVLACASLVGLVACTAGDAVAPATPLPLRDPLAGARPVAAPSLAAARAGVLAGWVQPGPDGVQLLLRALPGGESVVQALDAAFAFDLRVYPAAGAFHLLWLDAAEDGDGLRLYAAMSDAELVARVGPNALNRLPTSQYDAWAADDGTLHVAWTGGLPSEPALYYQTIDRRGRIRFPEQLDASLDHPALVPGPDGSLAIVALGAGRSGVWRHDPATGRSARIAEDVPRYAGDRLLGFDAAAGEAGWLLVWCVLRADGTPETWLASSTDGVQFTDAVRLDMEGEPVAYGVPLTGDPTRLLGWAAGASRLFALDGARIADDRALEAVTRWDGPASFIASGAQFWAAWPHTAPGGIDVRFWHGDDPFAGGDAAG